MLARYSWFSTSAPLAVVTLGAIAALTISFYVMENCSRSECPVKRKQPGQPMELGMMSVPLTNAVAYVANLSLNDFMDCILTSEIASLALVAHVWCVVLCCLWCLLAVLAPRPKPEEISTYRQQTTYFICSLAFAFIHMLGVSQEGFADVTHSLLLWAWRYAARQLRAIITLRSNSLRRASNINYSSLAAILAFQVSAAALHIGVTAQLVKSLHSLSPMIFLDTFFIPMFALHFTELAVTELLQLSEELHQLFQGPEAVEHLDAPSLWGEWRVEVVEWTRFLHDLFECALLAVHHALVFWYLGFQFRIGDAILLYDLHSLYMRLFTLFESHLRRALLDVHIQQMLRTATPEEAEHAQFCAICHTGLCAHGSTPMPRTPKVLGCSHVFHLACLRRWIHQSTQKVPACPICRQEIYLPTSPSLSRTWQAHVLSVTQWWARWPFLPHVDSAWTWLDSVRVTFYAPAEATPGAVEPPTDTLRHLSASTPVLATQHDLRVRLRDAVLSAGAMDPELSRQVLDGYRPMRSQQDRGSAMYTMLGIQPRPRRPHITGGSWTPSPQPATAPAAAGQHQEAVSHRGAEEAETRSGAGGGRHADAAGSLVCEDVSAHWQGRAARTPRLRRARTQRREGSMGSSWRRRASRTGAGTPPELAADGGRPNAGEGVITRSQARRARLLQREQGAEHMSEASVGSELAVSAMRGWPGQSLSHAMEVSARRQAGGEQGNQDDFAEDEDELEECEVSSGHPHRL